MILHRENPQGTTRKLLELINKYSKVEGYKITTQKSLAFHTLTMRKQNEKLRKQSHSPRIKCIGINLLKETKELYIENNKSLMKEIKDDT